MAKLASPLCCPVQLSLEELAKHKRPSFRPPEPATELSLTPDAEGRRHTEEDDCEEESMDLDDLEGSDDAGAEESTHAQQTPERETLAVHSTQQRLTVKISNAEKENAGPDMEEQR